MRKPTICIGENKDADQLRGNREADQRLCFLYTDSTLPLLLKYEISSFKPASVTAQTGLCRTCSETLLVFSRDGSYYYRSPQDFREYNSLAGLSIKKLLCNYSSRKHSVLRSYDYLYDDIYSNVYKLCKLLPIYKTVLFDKSLA